MADEERREINISFTHPYTNTILEATVSVKMTGNEIIQALIEEGFLSESEEESFAYALYFVEKGRSKVYLKKDQTLEEIGLSDNEKHVCQVLGTGVAYGCPTAKDRVGLVPECMLTEYEMPDIVVY